MNRDSAFAIVALFRFAANRTSLPRCNACNLVVIEDTDFQTDHSSTLTTLSVSLYLQHKAMLKDVIPSVINYNLTADKKEVIKLLCIMQVGAKHKVFKICPRDDVRDA